jgi:predicted enzyme related to lactoylglutathione lyase
MTREYGMRERDISAGAPCWIGLSTSDTAVVRDFYAGVFGWTAGEASADFGGYFMFTRDGVPVAGCSPAEQDSPTNKWSAYLTVDDIAKTLESVGAAGGQVYVPSTVVGDMGTMGVIADPGDAAIGIWRPDQFAGLGITGEAGLPSWFELHTRDYDAAVTFYREVFGWNLQVAADEPGFRYSTMMRGEDMLAGIADASPWGPDAPVGWAIYFWVDDADAAIARVTELGGSVIHPAEDTPYGRLATVADPNGATFKFMAANDQMPA